MHYFKPLRKQAKPRSPKPPCANASQICNVKETQKWFQFTRRSRYTSLLSHTQLNKEQPGPHFKRGRAIHQNPNKTSKAFCVSGRNIKKSSLHPPALPVVPRNLWGGQLRRQAAALAIESKTLKNLLCKWWYFQKFSNVCTKMHKKLNYHHQTPCFFFYGPPSLPGCQRTRPSRAPAASPIPRGRKDPRA